MKPATDGGRRIFVRKPRKKELMAQRHVVNAFEVARSKEGIDVITYVALLGCCVCTCVTHEQMQIQMQV